MVWWWEVPHTKCVLSTFYYHLFIFYHHSNIYFHVFYVKEVFRGMGEKRVFPACHLELEVINILHVCSTAKSFYCKRNLGSSPCSISFWQSDLGQALNSGFLVFKMGEAWPPFRVVTGMTWENELKTPSKSASLLGKTLHGCSFFHLSATWNCHPKEDTHTQESVAHGLTFII